MTAVEFILRELADNFQEEMQNLYSKNMRLVANICEQAKEMEKQQIIDARVTSPLFNTGNKDSYEIEAEQYYNEKFNK